MKQPDPTLPGYATNRENMNKLGIEDGQVRRYDETTLCEVLGPGDLYPTATGEGTVHLMFNDERRVRPYEAYMAPSSVLECPLVED